MEKPIKNIEIPWYIQEAYDQYKISHSEYLKLIKADKKGLPITVNIYDVLRRIYGLSLTQLAELFDVTIGVMVRAKNQGTPTKRVIHFANTLCIPVKFFTKTTTGDFAELERCKEEFFSERLLRQVNNKVPEWKEKMLATIIEVVGCERDDALKICNNSNFEWDKSIPLENLSQDQQTLINCLRTSKEGADYQLGSVEYKIDVFCGGVNLRYSLGLKN